MSDSTIEAQSTSSSLPNSFHVTVLIVDDEESVRTTFEEWLAEAKLDIQILTASGAETALAWASQQVIDLAVLDWNLGSGDNGLQLLQDLAAFHPNVTAIMITGFAQQATPLDAMRMGVRDYFDKNHDLNREKFIESIRRQLELIRPAKRERILHAQLLAFRKNLEMILPWLESAAALNEPVTLPDAIASLFRFLLRTTHARDGRLFVRTYDEHRDPVEICRVFDSQGEPVETAFLPFSQSLAGAVVSLGEAKLLVNGDQRSEVGSIPLQEFEKGHHSVLVAPLTSGTSHQAVIELFDKQSSTGELIESGFTQEDRRLAEATADFGGELFRHALAEQRTQRALADAVGAAMEAGSTLASSIDPSGSGKQAAPPADILDQLQHDLQGATDSPLSSTDTIRMAEAIRELAVKFGPCAVQHCLQQIESLNRMLDSLCGMEGLE